MDSNMQDDENILDTINRMIAEQEAKNAALAAEVKEIIEANERMEREKMNLQIEANEKILIEQELKIFSTLVSMNSHIDIADGSTNTKEVVQVIRDESEFSKNVTAITTKMAAIDKVQEVYENSRKDLKWVTTIYDRQMEELRTVERRVAAADAYQQNFEDELNRADRESKIKMEDLDRAIAEQQTRKARIREDVELTVPEKA